MTIRSRVRVTSGRSLRTGRVPPRRRLARCVPGGRPVSLVWTLPEPFGFCGDDNVYLKPGVTSDFRQAYESFGSSNADGSRGPNSSVAGTCQSKWHWNWRNTGTDLYPYNLQFTDRATGRKCTIDPWVRNG